MPVKVAQSCWTLCGSMDYTGQNTGVGSCSLLQGIFPNQGSNPDLPHCRRILYQLSHKGSLQMPEIKAIPWKKRTFVYLCVCVFGEVGTQKKEGWLHSVENRVHGHHINLLYTFLSMLISSKIQLPRFALKGEKVTCHSL